MSFHRFVKQVKGKGRPKFDEACAECGTVYVEHPQKDGAMPKRTRTTKAKAEAKAAEVEATETEVEAVEVEAEAVEDEVEVEVEAPTTSISAVERARRLEALASVVQIDGPDDGF